MRKGEMRVGWRKAREKGEERKRASEREREIAKQLRVLYVNEQTTTYSSGERRDSNNRNVAGHRLLWTGRSRKMIVK